MRQLTFSSGEIPSRQGTPSTLTCRICSVGLRLPSPSAPDGLGWRTSKRVDPTSTNRIFLPTSPNQPIAFRGKLLSFPASIALLSVVHFASCKASRPYVTRIHWEVKGILFNHSLNLSTPKLVSAAIFKVRHLHRLCPEYLNILPLQDLGPSGINYLTDLYNLSLAGSEVPGSGS